MKNELNISIGQQEFKCILMEGFPSDVRPTIRLHSHSYAEIHVFRGPATQLELDDRIVTVEGNCVFALPANQMHRFYNPDPTICHSAFLTAYPFDTFICKNLSGTLVTEYFRETIDATRSGNYARIRAYITLFCCDLLPQLETTAQPVTDLNFLVNNFFNLNYNKDISLSDLAKELHFSEKQTERLVQKHTGFTFKQALVNYRMSVAKYLEEKTNISLAEIAELVGYHSYNGFRKAYNQYLENNKKP